MGNIASLTSGVDSCLSGSERSKHGVLVTKCIDDDVDVDQVTRTDEQTASLADFSVESDEDVGAMRQEPPASKVGVFEGFKQALGSAAGAVGRKLSKIENYLFASDVYQSPSQDQSKNPTLPTVPKVMGGIRLYGCTSDLEHHERIKSVLVVIESLSSNAGLAAAGFEFRTSDVSDDCKVNDETDSNDDLNHVTRLHHIETGMPITTKNRREFIADGKMYDEIARLCQEYAQEIMIKEGNLEWINITEQEGANSSNMEPIKALVTSTISEEGAGLDDKPTLLIATGKGKVRAGIFSRQHIMVSGMECSTAIPLVREATKRNMNIVMLDPNAHGDRMGMSTFKQSMTKVFERWESDEDVAPSEVPPLGNKDLYILSHSQSGAHFARYLLEKSSKYVPHIRAVAFTDSTHNIQWARKDEELHELLQSEACIYFKSSNESAENAMSPLQTTGELVETDHFWEHRFGRIQTRCAGTAEHSLTNWFVRDHIWDHFDFFLGSN